MDILGITGSRADWGLLAPVFDALRDDPAFRLHLVVTGQHLMAGAASLGAIRDDGFEVDHLIDIALCSDDSPRAVATAMARAVKGMAAVLDSEKPDLMLVLGDRYEIQAAVCAALFYRVPVAHLCGGDVTLGAMDDAIRHSITKMAHIHFVSHADAARRVAQLGEDPTRIHNVGSPGLDRIRQVPAMERAAFFASVGLEPRRRNLLITFHPVTLESDSRGQCRAMLAALAELSEIGLLFTGSNADQGAREIDALIEMFVSGRENAVFCESLGSRRYFSALTHLNAVVGNSSSGLCEAPTFEIPTVNIGERQAGRPRAPSVIDCPADARKIGDAIARALALDCQGVANPYGDGYAAERILNVLKSLGDPADLVKKTFRDLKT